jgi:hypothetical protein
LARLWRVLTFIGSFDRVNRPRIEAMRLEHAPTTPVIRLRTSREIATFALSPREASARRATAR